MDDNFPCGNLCFRSDAVEKVELSVISEDPVVAVKSAEIPSYWDKVQLPKADPRKPEQADKPAQPMFSCPGDKPLLTKSCRPQEETVELVNEHQGMKRLEREVSDFPKEGSRQCRLPPFEDEPIRRSSPYRPFSLNLPMMRQPLKPEREPLPGIAAAACRTGADKDLVKGDIPVGSESEDEHEGIDDSSDPAQHQKTEEELDDALRKGDFDDINQKVTPETLSRCKSNTLLKAFQVNKALRDLAHDANSEKDDLEMLEKSIDEFTSALIDPLKADPDTRKTFQSCFDYVIDKAIDTEQKKFLSHPVVYNLLITKWYGSFFEMRKNSWWSLFDIVLFPFLFAIFFVVHLIKQGLRKGRETEMCFVLTLDKDTLKEEFDLIKKTMSYIVQEYGCQSANYCVILRKNNEFIGGINFEESLIFHQVVVFFLNYTLNMSVEKTEKLQRLVKDVKDMQVNIVPVGIGENAKLSELKMMVTKDGTALHFGEYESHETLGRAVIQGIEGKDIYEKYKDYFTTPYFVFFRDTLSYITLLILHFALCLSPSTVSFSRLELVLSVFFVGRIFMEIMQFISAKKNGVKSHTERRNSDGYTHRLCSPEDPQVNETGNDSILRKTFIRYFSDRWNVLDFIILVLYLITFILRMITLGISTDVSENRLLVVSEYFYGFIAMFLTIRAFGQVIERLRKMGAIQIALFFIISDVLTIFWQFLAMILAFALPMTKIYIAEKAYTSGKASAGDFVGLADLDRLNSVDNLSVFLVQVLYGLFLVMAVVLLVNMMIALLSNTYQQVQDNSLQEWSFKRAITVRTYSTNHPIPVPFNILSLSLMLLRYILLRSPCCRSSYTPALDEAGRSRTLDTLVKNLERRYFEKYGYKFPLTEEKKVDHLVKQNEGGRKMTNQIVREIFRPRGNKEEKLAFGQGAWYDSPGIAVDGCLLTYMGPDFCKKCKDANPNDIHSAIFKSPFTPETPRFEVLIQRTGERRFIALGAVNKDYDLHKMPGWYNGTVGYHVDDGKIFDSRCPEMGREIKGAMAYRGDLIACEVDFKGVRKDRVSVLFSLNGKEVGRSSVKYTSGQLLYPLVSLGFPGIKVLAKMCYRDRDRFSRVTNEDLQDQLDDLRRMLVDLRKEWREENKKDRRV
ncbi:hypothetical protein pdam_00011498 [Pocillopora damicornis]|uniref:SPRY domain-containing protein n=1 Tax=Pocillopora damicornis TaxID=46731 RepID=A0A3M6TUF6_POCDA|nr:hypothetical protein pdam_00011498 [Pocillopora damicornis]